MLLETADRRLRLEDTVAVGPRSRSTVGERWQAAVDAQVAAYNLNSEWRLKEEAFDASADGLFALTGVRLENPYRSRGMAVDTSPEMVQHKTGRDVVAEYEGEVERLAEVHPDKAAAIRQHGNVLAKAYARRNAAVARSDDALRRSPAAVTLPGLGPVDPVMLAGGIAGSLADPATLAVNAAGAVGKGASLLYHAGRAALINGAAELAMQPFIRSWANEAGDPYTWSDAAHQVVASALLGGALDAGVRGGFRGVQRARGLEAVRGPEGTITGWRQPGGAPKAPEQILDEAAQRLPPDNPVRRAAEGDAAAAVAIARATGATEDPAVRGLIQELELEAAVTTRVPGVDDGTGLVKLVDALRHAEDPAAHPPPGRVDPAPEARGPSLADDAPAPGRAFTIDGRPVTLAEVDLKTTAVDPATFQFKGGADAAGATDRLQGVERWDPIAAGRAVLYERADGTRVVADAHQRRALALRLEDQETVVPAFIFREADGWTPSAVRALAAKKNLQEGSGSAMDAATILRERPDILDASVPLRSETMRQARSLARLSDEAFAGVKGGVVTPAVGALVGDLVPDRARHAGILQEIAALDPASTREARLMVAELMQLPVHAETQMTLLGVTRLERSLMRERITVLDQALKALRQDARIFALLDREAGRIEAAGNDLVDTNAARAADAASVAETIERLAAQAGPVSDWLNAAARAVAAGEKPRAAAEAFAQRVADALEREGLAGLVAAPTPLRAGGFDAPGGPEAQAQVRGLEAQLSEAVERAQKPELAAERRAPPAVGRPVVAQALDPAEWRTLKEAIKRAQPFRTVDEMLPLAKVAHEQLTAAGREIAAATGATFRPAGLKSRARVVEKLEGRSPTNITDAARGGFVVKSVEESERVVAALAARFAIVDEGWAVTSVVGYFDRKVMVRFDNGVVGEVQMWPPGMFELKEAKGHALYKEWRRKTTTPERRAEIVAEMKRLYEALRSGLSEDFRAAASNASPAARSAAGASADSSARDISTASRDQTAASSTALDDPTFQTPSRSRDTRASPSTTVGDPSQSKYLKSIEGSPSDERLGLSGPRRNATGQKVAPEMDAPGHAALRADLADVERTADLGDLVEACKF